VSTVAGWEVITGTDYEARGYSVTVATTARQAGAVVDRLFSEPSLAELYDVFCSWDQRDDFDFYLPLVMSAATVLDVGCGTGALLHGARHAGHRGHLVGLDPADAMLEHARTRSDIEWICGDLLSVDRLPVDRLPGAFDLVVMTGHAFQVFVDERHLRASLAVIRSLLADGGRFVFETRNPRARAWERWTPHDAVEAERADGSVVRMTHDVETPVDGDLVTFTTTYSSPGWEEPRVSRSTLRFVEADALAALLIDAGLVIDQQFGDWDGRPLTDTSPEIITVARRDQER
jgi:SAM-dependent methyltransferase